MEVLEKIEKALNVKIEKVEEVRGRSFPLFDLLNVHGIKLALIKNPLFLVLEGDDVYEKKVEGNFIVIEMNKGYVLARYSGEPNIDALRSADSRDAEEPEEVDEEMEPEEEEAEMRDEEGEDVGKEGGEDSQDVKKSSGGGDEGDPIKEILEKMPRWADGVAVIKKDGNTVVLPIKRSTKRENAYYSSLSWKPLDINNTEKLVNHVVMKSGKVEKANVYAGDKYINIFIRGSGSPPSRPRKKGYYPRRRR
jgi:hypothetical protein